MVGKTPIGREQHQALPLRLNAGSSYSEGRMPHVAFVDTIGTVAPPPQLRFDAQLGTIDA